MQRLSPALLGSVTVVFAYILLRGFIYHFFPVSTLETWFVRDTWMTLPRLGAFATLLLLNRRWKLSPFTLPLKEFRRALILGAVPLGLWVFLFSGGKGERFTIAMVCIGFFTSLAVGVFEEYAFRGPLLFALRQRWSVLTSSLISSGLFAAYHFQAQPIRFWGVLFLTGMIFANLRFRGLSLGWLALIHGVTDASYFLFPAENPHPFEFHGLVLHSGLLAYAIATFPRFKTTAPPSDQSIEPTLSTPS